MILVRVLCKTAEVNNGEVNYFAKGITEYLSIIPSYIHSLGTTYYLHVIIIYMLLLL